MSTSSRSSATAIRRVIWSCKAKRSPASPVKRSAHRRALDLMTDTIAADIARAEDLAKRALAVAPRYSVARFAMAQVLRAQHRYDEAIAEYEAAVALNRNWAHGRRDPGFADPGRRRTAVLGTASASGSHRTTNR